MRDPFRCDGPTVISFSGGRTSGLMLRRTLDAHGGTLPPDVYVVFANTGRERVETLRFVADCAQQWSVPVRWIERDWSRPAAERWREVEYNTASRNGEPFAQLIASKQFLPNALSSRRFPALRLHIEKESDDSTLMTDTQTGTDSSEAYRLYLLGRSHLNKRTGGEVMRAVESFTSAVDAAPWSSPPSLS